jgi:hypothetical protein
MVVWNGGQSMWRAHFAVIRTFVRSIDAEIARSALEAAGVSAVLQRDDCGGAQPAQWMAGIALLVRHEDVSIARDVLDAPTLYAMKDSTVSER